MKIENLARSELTPAQESAYILRRKQIWDEINGSKKDGTFGQYLAKSMGRPKTGDFAREVADVTGDSKSGFNPTNAKLRSSSPVNPLILNDTEL